MAGDGAGIGYGLGLAVEGEDFSKDIFKAIEAQDARKAEFANQQKVRDQEMRNSEIKKYLEAVKPNYEGLNPIMYNKYQSTYLDTMKNLVSNFKNAASDVDVVGGAEPILDEYEKTRQKLIKTSAIYNHIDQTPDTDFSPSQRGAVSIYRASNGDADKFDAGMKELQTQKGGYAPLGDVSYTSQDGVPILGMAASPKPDFTKDDATSGSKLKDWQVTNVLNKGKTTEQIFSVPYTKEQADSLAKQYNVPNVPSVHSAYDEQVNKYGGEKQAVSAWLHTDEGYNNPANWNHGNPWEGPDVETATNNFREARMKGIADNAPTHLEKIQSGSTVSVHNIYGQEQHDLSNVVPQDPLQIGGGTTNSTNVHTWTNKSISNIPATPWAIGEDGKRFNSGDLSNAVVLQTRNLNVDKNGNIIKSGDKTEGVSAPYMLVSVQRSYGQSDTEHTTDTKSSGGGSGGGALGYNTGSGKDSKSQGEQSGSTSRGKSEVEKIWVPVRGLSGTEFGVTNDSFDRHYGSFNDNINRGKSKELQAFYNENLALGSGTGSGQNSTDNTSQQQNGPITIQKDGKRVILNDPNKLQAALAAGYIQVK